jgi:hypothetical protein
MLEDWVYLPNPEWAKFKGERADPQQAKRIPVPTR